MKHTDITIHLKNHFLKYLAIVCCCTFLGLKYDGRIRIYLIGDSTMADKPLVDNPEHGWGQLFPIFFSDRVQVLNHACNGRSTKSFITEGRWKIVADQLREGDYVFIEFGHNDAKKEDTSRFSPPIPDYRNNLFKFIRESREKKSYSGPIDPDNTERI